MSKFSVTNTFVAGTTANASQVNVNFSDILTVLNNLEAGTDTWSNVKIISTDANPMDVTSSASTTELSINNTATNGDPILSFGLSGTNIITMGVDDSDSDIFKIGTTDITTAVALSIPAAGSAVYFADGAVGSPSISFASDVDTGLYRDSSGSFSAVSNGSISMNFSATAVISRRVHNFVDGTLGVPGISFESDPDLGIRRVSSNTMQIVGNSVGLAGFSPTGCSMLGTTTNDSASAGYVGEIASSYASNVAAAATNVYGNVTSISLTAGDWDVSGLACVQAIATVTRVIVALSAFSGNTTTDHQNFDNLIEGQVPLGGANGGGSIPTWRVSISGTTTYYLKIRATYVSGSPLLDGRISARRVR